MTAVKIITKTIYFAGFAAAFIFDSGNFQFYYLIIFGTIQIVFIGSEYIISKRTVPAEVMLIRNTSPFTLKDLMFVIPFTILMFGCINLLFSWFNTEYLVTIVSIAVLSVIIQYLIVKDKTTATLLIHKNHLIFNGLWLRRYNLQTLTSLYFNGFDEVYIAEFGGSKKLMISQNDYKKNDLNKFFTVMIAKSNCNVLLSDNIKHEITAAKLLYGN